MELMGVFLWGVDGVREWGRGGAGWLVWGVLVALVMALVVFEPCCYASHCHS